MKSLALVFATVLLSSAAYAQSSGSSGTNQATPSTNAAAPRPATAQIAQQIKSNLQEAGFKNIRMMPSSFLVRAEDKNGNPVMMVINPDSVTAVSEIDQTNHTTGQSSDQGSNSSSTTNPSPNPSTNPSTSPSK
jgi:hypothetical protein